jgi:hypothetical protein
MSKSDSVPASAALSVLSTLTVPMLELVCLPIQLLKGFPLSRVQPLFRSVHRNIANLDHATKSERESQSSSKFRCRLQGAPIHVTRLQPVPSQSNQYDCHKCYSSSSFKLGL